MVINGNTQFGKICIYALSIIVGGAIVYAGANSINDVLYLKRNKLIK